MAPSRTFEVLQGVAELLGLSNFPICPKGVDVFAPFLDRMKAEGAVIVLKWDGERDPLEDPCAYTILVSGQVLHGEFIRSDEVSLELGLARVVIDYAAKKWGFFP